MRTKVLVALCLFALLGVGAGPAFASSGWDRPNPDYAILPGVSVGAIALGMPESLAVQAVARYGAVSADRGGGATVYTAGHVEFVVVDGRVVGAYASGDSNFYVVVPGESLHLFANPISPFRDAFGIECTDQIIRLYGMMGVQSGWDAFGMDTFYAQGIVLGVSVYAADAITLDALHVATCGTP